MTDPGGAGRGSSELQTVERHVERPGAPAPRGRPPVAWVLLAAVLVVVSVLAITSRVGVIAALAVAFVAGAVFFAVRREVAFLQVVAFLIHFDGLGMGPITIGRGVAVAVIGVIAYKLLAERWRPPALPLRHWIGPFALVAWGTISAAWAPEIGAWFLGLGALGLAVAYFAAAGLLVDSLDKIMMFLRAYWYGGIFGAAAGFWGLILGLRAFGLNGDPNLFGVLAASMIPLTIYYRRQAATTRAKWIYTAVLLLVLVGAAGAGSRSGVIGAAVALFGSLVYRPGASLRARIGSIVPAGAVTAVIAVGLILVNPNTVERGTDSSGRLDFWKVAVELIEERPVAGHGLQQIESMIPPRLAVTPGAEKLSDKRDAVGSHNTWLDMVGNLGFIGGTIFAYIMAVTIVGLLRPKWTQTREISGYLAIMFLPVITGSMFLGLINNKLSWSIIGLAGVLQVPSWGRRYRGYFSDRDQVPARYHDEPQDAFAAPELARWDVKVSQRFRVYMILGPLVGAVLMAVVASTLVGSHSASVSLMVPKLDVPVGAERLTIDETRVSMIHTLILSDAYGARLAEASGVPLSPSEVSDRVEVRRPDFGPYLEITFTDKSPAVVESVSRHMLGALDELVADGRGLADPYLRDEVRPTVPGEQRYYSGPLYLVVSETPDIDEVPPRKTWLVFVGALSGAVLAVGVSLLMQRRPRVNSHDDFGTSLGLPLWSHVGRSGRRNAATADQYSQVAIRAFEAASSPAWPRRMLVATPRPNRSARSLALGLAAAVAASGQKVVLVDAQLRRPWMSIRLGAWWRRGLADVGDGVAGLEEAVNRIPPVMLPRRQRRMLRGHRENLRLVPAGRFAWGGSPSLDVGAFEALDASVTTIVLAPAMLGKIPVGPLLEWADVVLYDVVEGSTVTFDAEDGALQVSTFARSPVGVVLSDV